MELFGLRGNNEVLAITGKNSCYKPSHAEYHDSNRLRNLLSEEMNEIERADTARGFKAMVLLFVVPTAVAVLWQSTSEPPFHPVLIVLCLAVIVWVFWRYRKSRTRQTATNSSALPPNKPRSLAERYQETIATHKMQIRLSGSYEIDNLVRDCIGTIAQKEGRTNLAPFGEYLYKWERRSDIPEEYRQLANQLKTDFGKRADELKKLKEDQVVLRAEKMLSTNWSLVEKFLEITERKVSILDDYGDEQWDVLPQEIMKFLKKLNEREDLPVRWESINKAKGKNWEMEISWHLPEEYRWMLKRLQELFQEHHEQIKSKNGDETDFQNLSGIEFETYIAKRLRSSGYDVRGTPTTGDQGGDLIAKKDGRTVVVQAKGYQGLVGNKAVQEVNSAVSFYGGDEGWVVTNSTFTPSAIALAQKTNTRLIDGAALKDKLIFLKNRE
jgi:Restriction endonuclease